MKTNSWAATLTTGLAMFSMFFGAGNVVFPLTIGQYAQDLNIYAMLGLAITAVGVPFLGLTAMTLFDGNYQTFFERIGKVPGFLLSIFILGLIGPFGATPRCITLSNSTMQFYLPSISLWAFSAVSCLIIFALTIKKNKILDVLGKFLTPILLLSLAIIIVMGWIYGPTLPVSDMTATHVFFKGLVEGYQTMDLLGAFFFSSAVLTCLKGEAAPGEKQDYKKLIKTTLKGGCIGMSLLAITYFGFSYVSAFYSEELVNTTPDALAGALALHVLGPYAGIIACLAVSLSRLTTAIALASVSAEFIHIDLTKNKIGYGLSLLITLAITFGVSTLHFNGIKMILAPILEVCYPALITLSVMNILHKLCGINIVVVPVAAVFALTLLSYLF